MIRALVIIAMVIIVGSWLSYVLRPRIVERPRYRDTNTHLNRRRPGAHTKLR